VARHRNPFVTALELIGVLGIMFGVAVCVVAGFILNDALVDARCLTGTCGMDASVINGITIPAALIGVGASLIVIGVAAILSYIAVKAVQWKATSS